MQPAGLVAEARPPFPQGELPMSNATTPSVEEFRRSLDALVQQAQQTAQLGLAVAREQVETLVKQPNVAIPPNLNEQVEEVRKNLQNMARDIETKAQEIVHLASTYVQAGPSFTQAPRASSPQTEVKVEPASGNESTTAAGTGTAQEGSNMSEPSITPNGEAPRQ
jgi:hypothetical protein